MTQPAFQENYPEEFAHCYGCGTQNEHGHQLKSYWDGDTAGHQDFPFQQPHIGGICAQEASRFVYD